MINYKNKIISILFIAIFSLFSILPKDCFSQVTGLAKEKAAVQSSLISLPPSPSEAVKTATSVLVSPVEAGSIKVIPPSCLSSNSLGDYGKELSEEDFEEEFISPKEVDNSLFREELSYFNDKSLGLPKYKSSYSVNPVLSSYDDNGKTFKKVKNSSLHKFTMHVDSNGKIVNYKGDLIDTGGYPGIFVMDQDGNIFFEPSDSLSKSQGHYHSTFLKNSGRKAACAGTFIARDGQLLMVSNESGHYAPDRGSLSHLVTELRSRLPLPSIFKKQYKIEPELQMVVKNKKTGLTDLVVFKESEAVKEVRQKSTDSKKMTSMRDQILGKNKLIASKETYDPVVSLRQAYFKMRNYTDRSEVEESMARMDSNYLSGLSEKDSSQLLSFIKDSRKQAELANDRIIKLEEAGKFKQAKRIINGLDSVTQFELSLLQEEDDEEDDEDESDDEEE